MCVIYLKQDLTEADLFSYIMHRGTATLTDYAEDTIGKVIDTGTSDYRKGKDKRTWEALHG